MNRNELLDYGPALMEAALEGAADDELALIARLDTRLAIPASLGDEVRLVTRFGDIATLRVRRGALETFAALPEVLELEIARQMFDPNRDVSAELAAEPEQDETLTDDPIDYSRRPDGVVETGAKVVVGVLDWGVDVAYPGFRHEDGSTRLLGFWDQRGGRPGPKNRWGYGRIFNTEMIDRALASGQPYAALNYHPGDADTASSGHRWQGTHGTHVLDIAAGNGLGGSMSGVAPEADLVFVHLAHTANILGRENLGDSASVLEALDYVFSLAGDRPCVINMSVGAHGGPHDGSTCVEAGIDRAVWLRDNRAVVNSAGNYFTARAHTAGRVAQGQRHSIDLRVPDGDPTSSELEIYYESSDRFMVEVIDPQGQTIARSSVGEQHELIINGRRVGRIYHIARSQGNHDRLVDIFFYPNAPGGNWQIRLTGERVDDGRFHAWIERDRGPRPRFADNQSRGSHTTGTLCNGLYSITVGAYDPHRAALPIGAYSSAGPTRDGRVKPELSAPGSRIVAARSAPPNDSAGGVARLTRKSGTSMAAPHVAGTIALMFEAAQAAQTPLPITELRALLFSSLRAPRRLLAEAETIHRHGFGMLDIAEAVRVVQRWRQQRTTRDGRENLLAKAVGDQSNYASAPSLSNQIPFAGGYHTPTLTQQTSALPKSCNQGERDQATEHQESLLMDLASVVFRHAISASLLEQQGWSEVDPVSAGAQVGDIWLRRRPSEGLSSVALITTIANSNESELLELAHPAAAPQRVNRKLPTRWRDTLLRQRM
ncbi:S8 family peptidase [Simiduia curdlanivorans]|uniref:S8 family peptidase n=1 Tax=Simiduia curdlanivorans TaxID=1492769 RepID=A0ABV8V6F1_9GAMM|nr:S8 family peptidase [Simiduia curdlanivorans]MDN3638810.1 S8 family peptidase [Simiduia curdlanivorans]